MHALDEALCDRAALVDPVRAVPVSPSTTAGVTSPVSVRTFSCGRAWSTDWPPATRWGLRSRSPKRSSTSEPRSVLMPGGSQISSRGQKGCGSGSPPGWASRRPASPTSSPAGRPGRTGATVRRRRRTRGRCATRAAQPGAAALAHGRHRRPRRANHALAHDRSSRCRHGRSGRRGRTRIGRQRGLAVAERVGLRGPTGLRQSAGRRPG